MRKNYVKYINKTLKILVNYINSLVAFSKKYESSVQDIYKQYGTKNNIVKSTKLIEFEEELGASYKRAKNLLNNLKQIAQNYKFGMNIDFGIQVFHNELKSTRLPVYKKVTLYLEPEEEVLTGAAAQITTEVDNDVSQNKNSDAQSNEADNTEESTTVLQGGIRYCHYVEQAEENLDGDNACKSLSGQNTDFYVDNDTEDVSEQGYNGDSIEAAAAYKRKYDEAQRKKAALAAQQKMTDSSKTQSASANWIMPCNGSITSPYGWRIHPTYGSKKFHDGIDIGVKINTPVMSVADERIVKAEWYNGYGKYIEIDHGNNVISFYGHLNKMYVSKGLYVKQGQVIALSGNTAGVGKNGKIMTTGPHLHFGLHINGKPKNPLDIIGNF